ncbi:hypothetical protein DICSQDRAFT_140843 [Dichomitus squalens LYAD-421 SS1]|uniref:Uncharacterized protein n=1 Tax=Dichomitus squalens (strain LYAD-421) TaxID=732165 RepID=R7SME4_DICSQ|nr:uncharacterized protein DICSQDRAFT_140843 [Dichomitus squalens LYAD-421 SS1]EJF56910.1 hypothetical protein DICSQDRAFT_140843 [Dichomitus squalens LYAD-421 SS1]
MSELLGVRTSPLGLGTSSVEVLGVLPYEDIMGSDGKATPSAILHLGASEHIKTVLIGLTNQKRRQRVEG